MKKITPKIINYPKDKRFQCLLSDVKIAFNYLEQYNGKPFENSDYLLPITASKMEWVKQYLEAALYHIQEMKNDDIVFT